MKKKMFIILGIFFIILSLILFYDYYSTSYISNILSNFVTFDLTGASIYIINWLINLVVLILGIILLIIGSLTKD